MPNRETVYATMMYTGRGRNGVSFTVAITVDHPDVETGNKIAEEAAKVLRLHAAEFTTATPTK